MQFELRPETAVAYLRRSGRLPARADARTTAYGGRANRVVKVVSEDGCVALKQPRPRLADEVGTPADPNRIHWEATVLRLLARIARRSDAHVAVPEVRFEDPDVHVIELRAHTPSLGGGQADNSVHHHRRRHGWIFHRSVGSIKPPAVHSVQHG
ncbi:hypothetical protein ATH50_0524 [Haloplanus aerogenes]|uniref:Aminoglycoside phosphotransferase domain-containing protein n=1 Tax=Haloplanus aerogenes TaxID=660522 RepID=A0A3M0DTN5_9EURY|nr:hypothetical protein ATH50_0524 [Haloplanus aerogenes]